MRLTCPKNASHDEFWTSITMRVGVIVDRSGEILQEMDTTPDYENPTEEDEFICGYCELDAIVTPT